MFSLYFFLIIFLIWYALSGYNSYFFIISGIICTALTLVFYSFLKIDKLSKFGKYNPFKAIKYCLWLIVEIFKASNDIIKIVWKKNVDISPTYGFIETALEDDLGKTIYANSITLTPGTVTLKVMDDKLYVHSLTKDSFDDILSRRMEKKIINFRDPSSQKSGTDD